MSEMLFELLRKANEEWERKKERREATKRYCWNDLKLKDLLQSAVQKTDIYYI